MVSICLLDFNEGIRFGVYELARRIYDLDLTKSLNLYLNRSYLFRMFSEIALLTDFNILALD